MSEYQNAARFHREDYSPSTFFFFLKFITSYTKQFRLENEVYHLSENYRVFRMAPQLTRAKLHTVDNTRFQSPPGSWYSFVVKASFTSLKKAPSKSRMFPSNS